MELTYGVFLDYDKTACRLHVDGVVEAAIADSSITSIHRLIKSN